MLECLPRVDRPWVQFLVQKKDIIKQIYIINELYFQTKRILMDLSGRVLKTYLLSNLKITAIIII